MEKTTSQTSQQPKNSDLGSTIPTTENEKDVLEFLNILRNSGATNMFGASPYIVEEFGVDRAEARRLLSLWMSNYNDAGEYKEVKI